MDKYLQHPFVAFLLKIGGAYAAWKVAYFFLETYPTIPWENFKNFVAARTVQLAAWFDTHLFRISVEYNSRNILVPHKRGVFLADHCIGIPAFVVFSLFIIVYSGSWKHKLWFIPLGILFIFFINALRTGALAYIQSAYTERFFDFNHGYTYLVTTYGLIFLFIVWWVEVFADKPAAAQ